MVLGVPPESRQSCRPPPRNPSRAHRRPLEPPAGVATDRGIFHKLQQLSPEKEFIVAPTAGNEATCRSCASCPWMGMNTLPTLLSALEEIQATPIRGALTNEVFVDVAVGDRAMQPLQRMLDFAAENALKVRGKA